ncbi:hypothetical protein ACO2Q9_03860 [Variovorax sp. VNK109]|uniref:hypothetical protein n=1 Tax=Variovorax sp. VNK109 TaxID=3400919 RepID=UPI003C0A8BF7
MSLGYVCMDCLYPGEFMEFVTGSMNTDGNDFDVDNDDDRIEKECPQCGSHNIGEFD